MANLSTNLAQTVLRHAQSFRRSTATEIKRMIATLEKSRTEIKNILQRNADLITTPAGQTLFGNLTPFQYERLKLINKEISDTLLVLNRAVAQDLTSVLTMLAQNESALLVAKMTSRIPQGLALKLNFTRLPSDLIAELINTPLGGLTFRERLLQNYGSAVNRMKAAITDGLIQSKNFREIAQQIDSILGGDMINRAKTIIRTELKRVSTDSNLLTYQTNSDVIEKLVWQVNFETVCPICEPFEGEEFDLFSPSKRPPLHPNCNCDLLPVVKGYKELGLTDEETPEWVKQSLDGELPSINA